MNREQYKNKYVQLEEQHETESILARAYRDCWTTLEYYPRIKDALHFIRNDLRWLEQYNSSGEYDFLIKVERQAIKDLLRIKE